jgi:hypothetical protein
MNNKAIKSKNIVVTFRVFQAIFFGILALGISSMGGEISSYVQSPISIFSITTTIFGLLGSIITGALAHKCKDW